VWLFLNMWQWQFILNLTVYIVLRYQVVHSLTKTQMVFLVPIGWFRRGFTNFAKLLQQTKTPWEAVVTRVSLPKGQTHGFFFTPIGYLNKEQFDKVKELQNSPSMHDALTVEIDATPAQSSAPFWRYAGNPADCSKGTNCAGVAKFVLMIAPMLYVQK